MDPWTPRVPAPQMYSPQNRPSPHLRSLDPGDVEIILQMCFKIYFLFDISGTSWEIGSRWVPQKSIYE